MVNRRGEHVPELARQGRDPDNRQGKERSYAARISSRAWRAKSALTVVP
jgi:hypothetical protein